MRTFGRLTFKPTEGAVNGVFKIHAEPHVMMKVKRLLPRVLQSRDGYILVRATAEIARDIEWITGRWPLDMDDEAATELAGRSLRYVERQTNIEKILSQQPEDVRLDGPALPARYYQAVASDLALNTSHLLVTDELGLGKSLTGMLLYREKWALPSVVVTLTHLPPQWYNELQKFFPWLRGHIAKKGTAYDPVDRDGNRPDVLFLSYSKLAGWADWLAEQVRSVIFDEMQELRRHGTQKYEAAQVLAGQADIVMGLTATPVYNYGGEIYNIMEVLAPDALGSREEFGREWGLGSDRKEKVKDPKALSAYLEAEGLMLGRTRKEVGRELPPAIPVPYEVDSDESVLDEQIGDAMDLARLILGKEGSPFERMQASGDFDMKMRQATGIAKAPYVADFVKVLLESEDQVVLWGWHRAVYEVWMDRLGDYEPRLYTGTESPTQKRRAFEMFMAGDCRVLVMSLRSGAGLEGLQTRTRVGVFGELDWSPGIHDQCIGRLRRDDDEEDDPDPVLAYFLVSTVGADPTIAETLNIKRMQGQPFQAGAHELLQPTMGSEDRVRRLAAAEIQRRGELR